MSQTAAVLRDLWVDHVFWVRNVSIATFNKNNAAIRTADKRVVANAQLIAMTIESFYGIAAQGHLFKLLKGHYGAVLAYPAAITKEDASAQAAAIQSLAVNAILQSKSISSARCREQSPARAGRTSRSADPAAARTEVRFRGENLGGDEGSCLSDSGCHG